MTKMTKMIIFHKHGIVSTDTIETKILDFIIKRKNFFSVFENDFFFDFINEMYPKLKGIIERFSYEKANFETFLLTCFKYEYYNFIKKENNKLNLDNEESFYILNENKNVYYQNQHLRFYELQDDFEFKDEQTNKKLSILKKNIAKNIKNTKVFYKRLYWMFLKNINSFDLECIKYFSILTDIDQEIIIQNVLECLEVKKRYYHKMKKLNEDRNMLYCKYLNIKKSPNFTNNAKKEEAQQNLDKINRKIQLVENRIKNIKTDLSNKDLAKILNIPAGTLDSGLSILKKDLNNKNIDFFILLDSAGK